MNYIQLNLSDKKYRSLRKSIFYTLLTYLLCALFIYASYLIYQDINETKIEKNDEIAKIIKEENEINKKINELNKAQYQLASKIEELGGKIESKDAIVNMINLIPSESVTEKFNKLENITKKNKIMINDFSLKDSEIFLYLPKNDKIELTNLITEFEEEFAAVSVREHSNNKIILKLGESNNEN